MIKKYTALLLLVICGMHTVFGQDGQKAKKYAALITPADARKHLSVIASDDYEGRETGTPGAEKAADYLRTAFQQIGLQAPVNGSYLLPVPLRERKLDVSLNVNGKAADKTRDYFIQDGYTNRDVDAAEIVFVGYGSDVEIGNADLRGKVVLLIMEDISYDYGMSYSGLAPTRERLTRVKAVLDKKPALLLEANTELTMMMKKYGDVVSDDPMMLESKDIEALKTEPMQILITNELADKLLQPSGRTLVQLKRAAAAKANIAKSVPAPLSLHYQVAERNVIANNVLGFLPGSDLRNEVLIFSAHYDHIGLADKGDDKVNNGADDDGSGTTALLELAQAFMGAKNAGDGPRRSILFLANVGEEKGLLGSEYYTRNPVFPLKNTVADLNIDMIGRIDPTYTGTRDSANYVYLVGPSIMSKDLKALSDAVNMSNDQLILDYKFDDVKEPEQIFFRSDHYHFAKKGVPVVFYTAGEHADYHKPGDEVSKINFPLLVRRTKLAFYTGWALANRDQRPKAESFKKQASSR